MTSGLANLPDDILIAELENLPAKDIVALSSASRHYRALYKDSNFLQYKVELGKAGCQDFSVPGNTTVSPSYLSCKGCKDTKEKIAHLKSREARWRDPDLRKNIVRINLGFELGYQYKYKLSAGILFLINESNGLRYIDIKDLSRAVAPSETSKVSEIYECEFSPHSIPIEGETIEIGLGVEEHDLITVLHAVAITADLQEIKLTCIQLSSGEPHPHAKKKTINLFQVPKKEESRSCVAWIEIVGNTVVLLVTYPNSNVYLDFPDRLYILDWTTGDTVNHKLFPRWSLGGIGFITPTLFVILDTMEGALGLFHTMAKDNGETALCRLQTLSLPKLDNEYSDMYCKGDSNLLGSSPDCIAEYINEKRDRTMSISSKGVIYRSTFAGHEIRSDPNASVITLNLECFHALSGMNWEAALAVHRSYLTKLALDSLKTHTTKTNEPPTSADEVASSTDGQRRTFSFEVDDDGDFVHTTPNIEWEDWGPENTRVATGSAGMTAGQRQVSIRQYGRELVIKDFNPYSIYLEKLQMEQGDAPDASEDPSYVYFKRVVESSEAYPSTYMEKKLDDKQSSLPYVEYALKPPSEHIINHALIDNERLVIIYNKSIEIVSMWP